MPKGTIAPERINTISALQKVEQHKHALPKKNNTKRDRVLQELEDHRKKIANAFNAPSAIKESALLPIEEVADVVLPTVQEIAPVEEVEAENMTSPIQEIEQKSTPQNNALENAFIHPVTEMDTLAKHMLEERMYELAKNQVEGARATAAASNKGWLKKLVNAAIVGVKNNFTTAEVKRKKDELLYSSEGKLSPTALQMLAEIKETIEDSKNIGENPTESEVMVQSLIQSAKQEAEHKGKWWLLGGTKLGFVENMKRRFGVKKDTVFSKSKAGGLTTTVASGLGFTMGLMGARTLLKSIPLVGGLIGGGIMGTKLVSTKLKGFDTFLSEYLKDTPFAGISKYTTESELRAKIDVLPTAEEKSQAIGLLVNLLEHAKENSAINNQANADAFVHFQLKVNKLNKTIGAELTEESQKNFEKKVRSIKSNMRKQMITAGIIGATFGAGAAGVMMTAGSFAHSVVNASTSTGSTVVAPASLADKTIGSSHASIARPTMLSDTALPKVITAESVPLDSSPSLIDEYRTMGGVRYDVLKANDGMNNFPVYAKADGTVPFSIKFAGGAEMNPLDVQAQADKFQLDLGSKVLKPTPIYGDAPTPIKVTVVSDEDIRLNYNNKATTTFYFNNKTGMVETHVICNAKTLDEELYHALYGIPKETHNHMTGDVDGTVDYEALEHLNEKRSALLSTNNSNAFGIDKESVHAHANTEMPGFDMDNMKNLTQEKSNILDLLKTDEKNIQQAKAAVARLNSLEMAEKRISKIDPGTKAQVEQLRDSYQRIISKPNPGTIIADKKGFSDYRAGETAKVRADLINNGFQQGNFSAHEQQLNNYYEQIRSTSQGILRNIELALDKDGSLEAMEFKRKILNEDTLTALGNERALTGIDKAAFDKGFLNSRQPTAENVALSQRYFTEDVRNAYKFAQVEKQVEQLKAQLEGIKIEKQSLTGAETMRSMAEQNYKDHLNDLKSVEEKITMNGGEKSVSPKDPSTTPSPKNQNIPGYDEYMKNAEKEAQKLNLNDVKIDSQDTVPNESYEDAAARHLKEINKKGISKQKSGETYAKNYDYDTESMKSAATELTAHEVLTQASAYSNFGTLVNNLLDCPEFTGTPGEKADKIVLALREFMAEQHKGGRLMNGEAFYTGDAIEVQHIKVGNNGLTLAQILKDPAETQKILKALINSTDGNPMGITSEEVAAAFDNPQKYWRAPVVNAYNSTVDDWSKGGLSSAKAAGIFGGAALAGTGAAVAGLKYVGVPLIKRTGSTIRNLWNNVKIQKRTHVESWERNGSSIKLNFPANLHTLTAAIKINGVDQAAIAATGPVSNWTPALTPVNPGDIVEMTVTADATKIFKIKYKI